MSSDCPTPYKQGFSDRADVMAALHRQAPNRGRTATKVYRCDCGHWHLAGPRRPVSEENRKRNHRRKGGRNRHQRPKWRY